jgi:hypothetical protein
MTCDCGSGGSHAVADRPDAYGAAYEGDGVQCGAIVCSGAQLCCLVEIASDATEMGPRQTCDQDCESVCADVCPDAGASGGGGAPPMMGTAPTSMPAMNEPDGAPASRMVQPDGAPPSTMAQPDGAPPSMMAGPGAMGADQ